MKNNAILVSVDDQGNVIVSFVTSAEAHAKQEEVQKIGGFSSAFIYDEGIDASLVYKTAPNVKARVEKAIEHIQDRIKWRDILDRNGLAKDNQTRFALNKALDEYLGRS